MVSDKYDRYGVRKGSLHDSFAGQQSVLPRVCQSRCVDLGCSAALRRCLAPVWRVLGAVRPRLTCGGASN